jgi:VanZ family protein
MNLPKTLPIWSSLTLILVAVLLIAYGSLYPFEWQRLPEGRNWWAALLEGLRRLRPGGRGDLLANLLLYLPLGGAIGLALRGRMSLAGGMACAVLFGAAVSVTIEVLQLFDRGRDTRGSDVVLNTISSGAGVTLVLFLTRAQRLTIGRQVGDGFAMLLVASWLGARLFPYVPSIDLQAWKNALKPLLLTPAFEPALGFCALVFWTLAAEAGAAASGSFLSARWVVPAVLLGTLLAKIIIVGSSLTLHETLGVLLALALWFSLSRLSERRRAHILLPLLLLAVLIERLGPFDFGVARSFGLIPFRSFLEAGGFGAGVQAGFTKLFLYGGLIWLACRAGFDLIGATVAVALFALFTSLGQIWLPGRSAEITDAVLAGLAGALLLVLRPRVQETARPRAKSPQPCGL